MHALILSVLLVLAAGSLQQETTWQEFSSAEGRFSASMPDEPKWSTIVTNTSEGRLVTHTISSSDKELNEFMISWTEYRQDSVERKATEKTFNKVRDALLAFKKGAMMNESAIQFDGHPGRALTFETPEGRVVTVRFGFFKNRFYQVMAETKRQNLDAGERFMKSFKLLPGTPV